MMQIIRPFSKICQVPISYLDKVTETRIMLIMKKDKQITVRLNLGEILASRGMTQREAASLTGIHKNVISVLAGEPSQIQLKTIAKLCQGLGVTVDQLFKVEEGK
jgi:DNA-binding Xre family transcriptional regulator